MSVDPLEPAWQRVAGLAAKLTEAVDALDDAGGLKRLAPTFRPKARDKALETLTAEISVLKSRRRMAPPQRLSERPVR